MSKWWITTDALARGGKKILGPFESQELALEVRVYVEAAHKTDQYWVDNEGEAGETLVPEDYDPEEDDA